MTLVELPDGTWVDPDAVIAVQAATFDGGAALRLDVPGDPLVVACSVEGVMEAFRKAQDSVEMRTLDGTVLRTVQ